MSTTDHPGEGTTPHMHHHPDREGEYPDTDVTDATPEESVGEYADTDIEEPRPAHPHDEGSFADHDVVSEHRHPEAEGSFSDVEIGDEDVEANQVARAHHDHRDEHETPIQGRGLTPPGSDPA